MFSTVRYLGYRQGNSFLVLARRLTFRSRANIPLLMYAHHTQDGPLYILGCLIYS